MTDFKESKIWHFDSESERIDHFELFLPVPLSDEVEELTRETARRKRAESDDKKHSAVTANRPLTTSLSGRQSDGEKEKINAEEILRLQNRDRTLARKKSTVKIFNMPDALKLLEKCKLGDRESQTTNAYWYKTLFKDGLGSTRRSIASLSSSEIASSFAALCREFPHFRHVIAHTQGCLDLAVARNCPPKIRPILLVGPPGVGKTHFCANLAQLLKVPLLKIAFDTEVTSSRLLGSDRNWGNSLPGEILETLADEIANPVVLLDEIDKARGSGQEGAYQSPIASLHGLLEPVTATSVQDISLSLRFDASWITFIATTNNVGLIPLSLRSRFTEFLVLEPTGEDALQFASSLLGVTHKRLALPGFDTPNLKLSKHVAHLDARSQIKAYESAYSSALGAGRNHLEECDLHRALGEDSSNVRAGYHLH